MTDGRYGWHDNDRVVPAYALTQGRTRSTGEELPLEALVQATAQGLQYESTLQVEWRVIVTLAAQPKSVAEIGAALMVPLGVARVLVSDLAGAGYLTVHLPPGGGTDGGPSRAMLGRLLDGLRTR